MRLPTFVMLAFALMSCGPAPERPPRDTTTATPEAERPLGAPDTALLCRDILNSHQCAQVIERHILGRGAPAVVRHGRSLEIRLATGVSRRFVDSLPDRPDGEWFSYRGFLAQANHHVLHVQFYEGDGYLLVHTRTGATTPSVGLPVLSPDARRIAAANVDLDAEYSPTALQIWRVEADRLVLEWERDFVQQPVTPDRLWGPGDLTWVSPTELRVSRDYGMAGPRGSARLRLGPTGWALTVE
ncbi:MAG: hypothetical protein MUF53_04485 [Gemmatimonadaceae bacterium]|nr:hypothetical protein [Gemmatimonadaceae bacterium]